MGNKQVWRQGALLLAALLCILPLASLSPSAAQDGASVVISTVDDLKKFARNCALDTWSQGKTVSLTADLNLEGSGFTSIPTFGGTFLGNGHTISGLSLTESGSNQGLFRYVQRYGSVQDLNVSGSVTPVGTQSYTGGIAGVNHGTLAYCSFTGTVSGKSYVGGVAGMNESDGTIFNCTAGGSVRGEHYTGGIAGANRGTLSGCVNDSEVNTTNYDVQLSLDDLQLDLEHLNSTENVNTTTDTGGVAGYSEGFIQTCTNNGTIGYPHVGYNVGGVVGRSAGYMENAKNYGTVYGRKDVGGIAGQMAPDLILKFSSDKLSQLEDELSRLDDIVNSALDRTDDNISAISSRIDNISDYAGAAKDSAKEIADQTTYWIDDNIEEIDRVSVNIADALEQADPIMQEFDDILDVLADAIDQTESLIRDSSGIFDYGSDAMAEMQLTIEAMDKAIVRMKPGLQKIKNGMDLLQRAVVIQGERELNAAKDDISDGLDDISGAISDIRSALETLVNIIKNHDTPFPKDDVTAALSSISAAMGSTLEALRSIASAFVSVAVNFRIDVEWSTLSRGFTQLGDGISYLHSSLSALDQSMVSLGDAMESLDLAMGEVQDLLDPLADTVDTIETAIRDAADSAQALADVFHSLAEKDPVAFVQLGDDYRRAGDNLYAAVSGISDEVSFLSKDVTAAANGLTDDLRAISTQFQVILDLFISILDDSGYDSSEELRADTSEEDINSTTMGKARRCLNEGSVNGDINVGGIAGAMAIEYDLDPEDDISKDGQDSLKFTFETKAIVQSSVNRGEITAKKNNAGGIAGRMDLGLILDCEGYGKVQSSDGDYVGGIAGYASSTIRSSYAKCTLSGSRYIGGIAGYAAKLLNCYSLVRVLEGGEAVGAIAGTMDEDSDIRGNRFVSESLAGIDGVSYGDIAAPIDYQTLLLQPGLPGAFKTFTLTYRADGAVVAEIPFQYGADLSDLTLPEIPAKDGCYGVWPDFDYHHLIFDEQFDAVYAAYITTIASSAMRDGTHSLLLAEGAFNERSHLSAVSSDAETMSVRWYQNAVEQWDVALTETDDPDNRHTLRFTPPDTRQTILLYARDGDGWKNIDYTQDGSALVFSMEGETMTLCVVESMRHYLVIACASLAAILLLAMVILLKKRRRRRGKGAFSPRLLKKIKEAQKKKTPRQTAKQAKEDEEA